MSTQTRTLQRQILEKGKRDGYDGLYFYVEFQQPPSLRKSFADDGHYPACHPGEWIPVIPVAPDPSLTQPLADMLCAIFAYSNPSALTFSITITHLDKLKETGCSWYEFGTLDEVCPVCAAVGWESCCCEPNVRCVNNADAEVKVS